jgi:hypothetical protein
VDADRTGGPAQHSRGVRRLRHRLDQWNAVFQQTGIVYRTTRNLKIDGLFFSTFFGGRDSSWASPSDQYAEFAEFSVRTI